MVSFFAGVVELADTPCSERGARKGMRVQVPPPALPKFHKLANNVQLTYKKF